MLLIGRLLTDPSAIPEPGWLRVQDGRIAEIGFGDQPPDGHDEKPLGSLKNLICPAFIDAHVHLPQVNAVGCDGLGLLDWLDSVVYPAEVWWGRGAGKQDARTAARRMLREGTLGFAAYLTSCAQGSRDAVQTLLAGVAGANPLRFIAGRVAMDRGAPDELTREDQERASLKPTPPITLAGLPRVSWGSRGAISCNPRFALACSEELLAEAGWARRNDPDLFVQTHLAETEEECARVKKLFGEERGYAFLYDRFGLLGPRTLLAHCVHLTDGEWDLVAERRAVAVHCPQANIFLRSGLFDLDAAREREVRLALGSDVAAGADLAMPRVARSMIETAKARKLTCAPEAHVPTPAEAWGLVTRGNADALGWLDAGRLEVGAAADLLLLRLPEAWLDGHLVGRLLYNWTPGLIEHRVVMGASAPADTIV